MVKYVLSSPWDSEKRNFDLFVCLVHVKKLTIKLTLTLTDQRTYSPPEAKSAHSYTA